MLIYLKMGLKSNTKNSILMVLGELVKIDNNELIDTCV